MEQFKHSYITDKKEIKAGSLELMKAVNELVDKFAEDPFKKEHSPLSEAIWKVQEKATDFCRMAKEDL